MALILALFLAATFLGGLTSGLTGFAAGLVVSGVWLHIITPIQTAMLIVGYGVVNARLWHLEGAPRAEVAARAAVHDRRRGRRSARRLCCCTYANPAHLRIGVGVLLVALQRLQPGTADDSRRSSPARGRSRRRRLERPARRPDRPWRHHQSRSGVQLRGGPKDAQRAIFQPVLFATMAMTHADVRRRRRLFNGDTVKLYSARLAGAAGRHCGSASNSTASSTMRRSARSSCCCCWCPDCR